MKKHYLKNDKVEMYMYKEGNKSSKLPNGQILIFWNIGENCLSKIKKMLTTEKGLHVHGFVRVMILLLCMIYSSRENKKYLT